MEGLSDQNGASKEIKVKANSNNASEIARLELEIEQKNDILLQLQTELQKQEDYNILKQQHEYV